MEIITGEEPVGAVAGMSVKMSKRKLVKDGWVWNGKYTHYEDGSKSLNTIRQTRLIDIARSYWLEGYIPIKGLTEDVLREMEVELQQHLKGDVQVPSGKFLTIKTTPDLSITGDESLEGKKVQRDIDLPDSETLKLQYGER